jgi:DNA-binding CsgD family transcriptional regulator
VSRLSVSTREDLDSSKYYREILKPLGLADEMRVLLREDGQTWGLLVLCRAGSRFTEAEAKQADEVGRVAVTALRRSLLLSGMDTGTIPDAPGLLILDGEAEVSASPTAREWLDDLPEGNKQLPYAVRAVAARSRTHPVTPARSRTRTRTGRWAALHAWRLSPAMTAVAIGPAEPGELAAIVLDAYGLTARERDVTQQVLLGRSTAQIATALGVSAYTVQDHLKAVFDKTGVRSRRELISDVFAKHYLPNLADPPLSTDGRMR